MFTRMHHRSSSWSTWIQFACSQPISLKATDVLFFCIHSHISQVVSFRQVFKQELFLHFTPPLTCHVPHAAHDSPIIIILHRENNSLSSSLCYCLQNSVTSSLFGLWSMLQCNPPTSYKIYNRLSCKPLNFQERNKLQDHTADTWYA